MASQHGTVGRYANAPIVDAVIDFRAAFPATESSPSLDLLIAFACQSFPEFDQGPAIREVLTVDVDGTQVNTQTKPVTLRLKHKKLPQHCLLRPDGLSYTHQAPYSDWKSFSTAAKAAWQLYIEHFKPSKITRYAIRYINRIEIEEGSCDIADYFTLYPKVPEEFPESTIGMFMQMQFQGVPLEKHEQALVNMGLADQMRPGSLVFILDFDLFGRAEIDTTSNEVWEKLDQLSKYKNTLFESSITDKTRNLFK